MVTSAIEIPPAKSEGSFKPLSAITLKADRIPITVPNKPRRGAIDAIILIEFNPNSACELSN